MNVTSYVCVISCGLCVSDSDSRHGTH